MRTTKIGKPKRRQKKQNQNFIIVNEIWMSNDIPNEELIKLNKIMELQKNNWQPLN